jgi:peptidoglycan/LPS O-acetylase OafA/YrhL
MLKPPAGHLPQLDALRTLAVGLVIVYHWFPIGTGINRLPNGAIGVTIFFVISGFLITRILLRTRNQVRESSGTTGTAYRNFLIRRALRIFPLYYLVITLVGRFLPQATDIDQHPAWYYFYGYNILLHRTHYWADVLSPFWTLGVEEQFYLVWPWVVLLTPPARFRWAIAGLIGGAVLFRGWSFTQGDTEGLLTPASVDAFGLGAVWAYVLTERTDALAGFVRRVDAGAALGSLAFVGLLLLPAEDLLGVLLMRLVISVLALWLVVHATLGVTAWPRWLLNNPAVQYVGRISYGIYVFHMLVPGFLLPPILGFATRVSLRLTNHPLPPIPAWAYQLLSLSALIGLASLSWYAFEKPINELKAKFK